MTVVHLNTMPQINAVLPSIKPFDINGMDHLFGTRMRKHL
jgi:hypothetical protein